MFCVSTIVDLMKGRNSLPMWDLIRFVMWRFSLSSFGNWSCSSPRISLLSEIPTRRLPPDVFRNAVIVFRISFSILLSNWFV